MLELSARSRHRASVCCSLPENHTEPRQSKKPGITCAAADLAPKCNAAYATVIYDPVHEPLQDAAPGIVNDVRRITSPCPECSLGKDVLDVLATRQNESGIIITARASPPASLSKISAKQDAHAVNPDCCGQAWMSTTVFDPATCYQPVAARR
ncbi:hypothetical protein KCP73_18445 [Salmonella enterica subsp. enterica]|nr:hypothetical protein KCP73_18445 [Salmonella enterica subsp. enterica]